MRNSACDIVNESVFALSLQRNLTVSKEKRQRTALFSCLDYGKAYILYAYIPYLIQVWGIASSIFSWVLSEPRCR